ncbi:BTAD domain-containing putative transcriptional regulator [Streptomyces sp. NPDC101209]|uniref:AfsR/SARP family transcriptional regulator n=1 Tax=Streptomyces sp. NPDC101209 TaxID=3366129 RepID=UPI003830BCA6
MGTQRLVTLLAVNGDIQRAAASELLWPDCPPKRAAANLRTALCRGRRVRGPMVINTSGARLQLAPSVTVDLYRSWDKARQIVAGHSDLPGDFEAYITDLTQPLLPDWSEEWLTLERERWDQMRQHALEILAQQFVTAGRYLPALQTALSAIAIDPIRETAHRIIVEIHLEEGDIASALKRYRNYQALLKREFNVAPSRHMTQLVQKLHSA